MKKISLILTLIITFFSFTNFSYALTNIKINNQKLVPEFDANTHVYNVFVSSKTEIITISVDASEGEIITGSGSKSLKKGLNEIEIISYINEEPVSVYTLNIIRGEFKPNKKDATLETIEIENHTIDFESDIYNYVIDALEDENKLNITYKTSSPTAHVKMTGDTNLNKEKNIIKLEVTSEDKKTQHTYKIIINKEIKKEEKNEKRTSIFDGREFSSFELKLIIIGLIILGIIIIGILFYFIFIKKKD